MSVAERRRHPRLNCIAAVGLAHQASGREFRARCLDASVGGVLLRVPADAPLAAGQYVTVNFPAGSSTDLPFAAAPHHGVIVRVDRSSLLAHGHNQAAVAFD